MIDLSKRLEEGSFEPKRMGFGRIGVTHCKMLANYVHKNYKLDQSFYDKYLYGYRIPIFIFKRQTPFVKDPSTIDYTVYQDVAK